jgi:hypothetical protein
LLSLLSLSSGLVEEINCLLEVINALIHLSHGALCLEFSLTDNQLSEIESTFHLLKVLEYDRAQSFEVALLLL